MSIKSDKWIRRMAERHGMIEPFEPGQVRQAEGCRLHRPLAQDAVLRFEDVELPDGRLCDRLWQEQMQRFFPHHHPDKEALHEIAGHRI